MDFFEGQNWAILKSVKVIQFDKATFPENQNPIDFNSVLIENGYDFEEIPSVFESAGFSENEKTSGAGSYFDKNVTLTIPKLRTDVNAFLANYKNRKLVLLITDLNEISHLVFPVRMSVTRCIPGQATSLNATFVEFSGNSQYESPIVTGLP